MKWIARIVTFVGALVIGGFGAELGGESEAVEIGDLPVAVEMPNVRVGADGIRVMYAGWEEVDGRPSLRFVIYNGSEYPITYRGVIGQPDIALADIGLNGLVDRRWECRNGTEEYTVPQREVFHLYVDPSEFHIRPAADDAVTVEFEFWRYPDDEAELFRSEPFRTPQEVLKQIRQDLKRY